MRLLIGSSYFKKFPFIAFFCVVLAILTTGLATAYTGEDFPPSYIMSVPGGSPPPVLETGMGLVGNDIVLVFDTSASMMLSDPSHAATNAAGVFLDSLYASSRLSGSREVNGKTRVGIVTYNDEVQTYYQQLISVDSEESLSALNSSIYSISFSPNTGDNGLVDALQTAISMFRDSNGDSTFFTTNYPISLPTRRIILLTDGFTDTGDTSSHNDFERFISDEVQRNLESFLSDAKRSNCEVCVIGLNSCGNLSQTDKDWIQRIANDTQLLSYTGLMPPDSSDNSGFQTVNYYFANTTQDVQKFYINQIPYFTDYTQPMMLTAGINNDGFTFDLNVKMIGNSAATIYLLSDTGIEGFNLINPSGGKCDLINLDDTGWNEDRNIHIQWWAGCATATIINPSPGIWRIETDGYDCNAYCAFIGGLDITLDVHQVEDTLAGQVVATISFNGTKLDENAYASIQNYTCYLYSTYNPTESPDTSNYAESGAPGMPPPPVYYPSNTSSPGFSSTIPYLPFLQNIELSFDSDANALVGSFEVSEAGEYYIGLLLEASDTSYRKSDTIKLTASGTSQDAHAGHSPSSMPTNLNLVITVVGVIEALVGVLIILLIIFMKRVYSLEISIRRKDEE